MHILSIKLVSTTLILKNCHLTYIFGGYYTYSVRRVADVSATSSAPCEVELVAGRGAWIVQLENHIRRWIRLDLVWIRFWIRDIDRLDIIFATAAAD